MQPKPILAFSFSVGIIHAKNPGASFLPRKMCTKLGSTSMFSTSAPSPSMISCGSGRLNIFLTFDFAPSAPIKIFE